MSQPYESITVAVLTSRDIDPLKEPLLRLVDGCDLTLPTHIDTHEPLRDPYHGVADSPSFESKSEAPGAKHV